MPKYDCEVRNPKGEVLRTQLEAKDLGALTNLLKDRQFVLLKATEVKAGTFSFSFGGSVSHKDLLVFTVQLSTLVSAAIPLVESVGILADQAENPYFKTVLGSVTRDLQGGQPFSSALRKHPKVFDRIYCNMCEAGETGGILDQVLKKLAEFAEADADMRGKIKGALTMPIVQLVLALLCVVFLLIKIFPNFTTMFKKMKADLPALTKALIMLSDMLIEHMVLFGVGAVVLTIALVLFLGTATGERVLATLSVTLPILAPLTKKIAVSRFSRTLCSLLGAGVPILNALQITQSVMGNSLFEETVAGMAIGVQQGSTLTSTIKGSALFPPMVRKMMEVGENSGNLDIMLSKVADFYDREVAESLEGLTAAITPVLTVFMGAMIGTIALSVFMPLFSIVQQMK